MGRKTAQKKGEIKKTDMGRLAREKLEQGIKPEDVKSLRLRQVMKTELTRQRGAGRREEEFLKVAEIFEKATKLGKIVIRRGGKITTMTEEELIKKGISPDKFVLVGDPFQGFKIVTVKRMERDTKFDKESPMMTLKSGFKIYSILPSKRARIKP